MANLQLPFGIEVLNQKPADAKYFLSGETPYNDISEVNSTLVSGIRHTGLTVNIAGDEYWYKNGIGDLDLILKSGDKTNSSGERIEKDITQSSHGFSVGDVVGYSGGTYVKAIATLNFDGEVFGLVSKSGSTDQFTVVFTGYVTGLTSVGLLANTTYFLSDSVAGELSTNIPSISGSTIKPILTTTTVDEALVFQYLSVAVSTGITGTNILGGINIGGGEEVFGGIISGTTMSFRTLIGTGGTTVQTIGNAIYISGGTSGSGSTSPGGGNTNIQFNDNGVFSGVTGFTFSATTNSITLGTRCISSHGNFSTSFGCRNIAQGDFSITHGCRNIASGCTSIAMGLYSCAMGRASVAMGNRTESFGIGSHAEGGGTCAIGLYSHAEGNYSYAIGNMSHVQGYGTTAFGRSSHAGGYGDYTQQANIFACGFASFNHSQNTPLQVLGHGANADNSAILGGINHNIESGNTRAAIIGGNAIKLTGTTYIDTTALPKLALISGLTENNTSAQILVRNTSTGIVDYVDKSSLSGSTVTASNGLTKTGDNIVLGGSLTGDTTVDTNNFGIVFGWNSLASGNTSFAVGYNTKATGNYSHAQGFGTQASGLVSHAEGGNTCAIGYYSHTEGRRTCAIGNYSHAEGRGTCGIGELSHAEGSYTCACAYASHSEGFYTRAIGSHSHAQGDTTSAIGNTSHTGGKGCFIGGRFVIACGISAFNHSENTTAQVAGHGALANNSAILGGRNHNIESGNTGATIIGGDGIKLTGTTYIDTTAVAKLALISGLTENNTSAQILVRNTSTGIVDYVDKSSLSGSTVTASNGLTKTGDNIVLGGTLTGDTVINTNNNNIGFGYNIVVNGNNSFAAGYGSEAIGNYASIAIGYYSCAIGDRAVALAGGIATGATSFATSYARSYGDRAFSFSSGRACGAFSFAGQFACASGSYSIALGNASKALGNNSVAIGLGQASGGYKKVFAIGDNTVNISRVDSNAPNFANQNGAISTGSAIFGGINHLISGSSSNNATIVGGNSIRISGTTNYIDHTIVDKLAIISEPVENTGSTEVLVRDSSTGIVGYVDKSDLANIPENIIIITGATTLDTSNYIVLYNNSGATATITLPPTPIDTQRVSVKDVSGNALNNNITIAGNGINIEGASIALINTDYGGLGLLYNITINEWVVLTEVN